MLEEIEKIHRYPGGTIIPGGNSYRVHEAVAHDYMLNRWKLKHGIPVEPFDMRKAGEAVKQI